MLQNILDILFFVQVDPVRLGPVSIMTPMNKPSTLALAATQHDSLLHLVDCRTGAIVTNLKVSAGSAGLIRCICADQDGYTVTIGHSSGFISQLDIRTGKLRQAWKVRFIKSHFFIICAINTLLIQ